MSSWSAAGGGDGGGAGGGWGCAARDRPEEQPYNPMPLSPYDRLQPDGHYMPPPTALPWNVTGLPWGATAPPQLVHFTGQPSTMLHCKRKPAEVESIIPAKQFITEEKMAAHLSGLHISHEYTEHTTQTDYPSHSGHTHLMDTQTVKQPHEWLKGVHKVVLADEIKKLKEEPLIPPVLLERLEKPCMSLMVWTPKESMINPTDEDDESKKTRNPSATSERRNGLLVAEQHGMDVEM